MGLWDKTKSALYDLNEYKLASTPVLGGLYAGVKEGRAESRQAARLAADQMDALKHAAVVRALSGKRHSGPAFSPLPKMIEPPDNTKLGILRGISNLSNQFGSTALTGGMGG